MKGSAERKIINLIRQDRKEDEETAQRIVYPEYTSDVSDHYEIFPQTGAVQCKSSSALNDPMQNINSGCRTIFKEKIKNQSSNSIISGVSAAGLYRGYKNFNKLENFNDFYENKFKFFLSKNKNRNMMVPYKQKSISEELLNRQSMMDDDNIDKNYHMKEISARKKDKKSYIKLIIYIILFLSVTMPIICFFGSFVLLNIISDILSGVI